MTLAIRYGLGPPREEYAPRQPRNRLLAAYERFRRAVSDDVQRLPAGDEWDLVFELAGASLAERSLRPHPEEAEAVLLAAEDDPICKRYGGFFLSACYNASDERQIAYRGAARHHVGYRLAADKGLLIPAGARLDELGIGAAGALVVAGSAGNAGVDATGTLIVSGHVRRTVNAAAFLVSGSVETVSNVDRGGLAVIAGPVDFLRSGGGGAVLLLEDPNSQERTQRHWTPFMDARACARFPELRAYIDRLLAPFSPDQPVQAQCAAMAELDKRRIMADIQKIVREEGYVLFPPAEGP